MRALWILRHKKLSIVSPDPTNRLLLPSTHREKGLFHHTFLFLLRKHLLRCSSTALRILLITHYKKRTNFRKMGKEHQWNNLISLWLHNNDRWARREVESQAIFSASGCVALSLYKSWRSFAVTDNTIWFQEAAIIRLSMF